MDRTLQEDFVAISWMADVSIVLERPLTDFQIIGLPFAVKYLL